MKLGTKIAAGFAALIIIALAISYSGWTNLGNVESLGSVTADVNVAKQLVSDSRGHIKDFLINGFATTRTDGKNSVELYEEVYQQQKDGFASILASEELTESDQSLVKTISTNADDYRTGVDAIVDARKSKDEAFKEWGRLGWAITDKVNNAMDEIVNPARIEAENADDIEGVKKWSHIGAGLDQSVIEPFLLLRVTAVYLIATNAEAQWNGYQKQLAKALEGTDQWENTVREESQLVSAANQIKGYLNEYKAAGAKYYDAVLTSKSEYDAIIVTAVAMTNNMNRLQSTFSEREESVIARANTLSFVFALIGLILGVGLAIVITRSITKPINGFIASLSSGSAQVGAASQQVASAGQSLASGATEQAASLEETSSSLEEMASMTRQNADNAQHANTLAASARDSADSGTSAMKRMAESMNEIKNSSQETAKIIKVIDEIAFQTNLLALNAAVEAARAGEAGKGFAVVAEEVRNLAMRSAEAARNTNELIDSAQKSAEDGVTVSEELQTILGDVNTGVKKVTDLLAEVAAASSEQSQGVVLINTAVAQMDEVTQSNAAAAEESSAASEELAAQAEQMSETVGELNTLVFGASAKLSSDMGAGPKTASAKLSARLTERAKNLVSKPQRPAKPARSQPAPKPAAPEIKEDPQDIIPLDDESTTF
jgi:methyl-accepting chemotaxis protein